MATTLQRSRQLAALATKMVVGAARSTKARRQQPEASSLLEHLCRLHGLPQKLAQMLMVSRLNISNGPGISIGVHSSPVSKNTLMETIEESLGVEKAARITSMNPEGITASIGQVHECTLRDGSRVAIKVQYPGINNTVQTDLKALGWLARPIGTFQRGFNLTAWRAEIGRMLSEELDYRREAEMLEWFGEKLASFPGVVLPKAVKELCSDHVLTMTWLDGVTIEEAAKWPEHHRQELSQTILDLFLRSCFYWKRLHADPNPGNYRFLFRDGKPCVGLLDFGCVKQLPAAFMQALGELVHHVIVGEKTDVFGHYLALGFDGSLLEPMRNLLPELTKVLLKPFSANAPFDTRGWNISEEAAAVLGQYRQNFRFAGSPELFCFIRAFQGLVQYLRSLDTPLNWRHAFENAGAPHYYKAPDSPELSRSSTLSTQLCVHVAENGHTRAKLTFPATATENLPDLVPPEIHAQLAARCIDVAAIARGAMERNLAPGELFSHSRDGKTVRVWLQ